ncbi:MAG: hypothetical protein RLZZ519_1541 [Bacteroidota bacterium]|jgi:hypothetical protein
MTKKNNSGLEKYLIAVKLTITFVKVNNDIRHLARDAPNFWNLTAH